MRTIVTTLALLAFAGAPAAAQGALSTQGFGYPPGQLSAHALGAAGAIGESDPQSALNPAALSDWGRPAVLFTWAPEFRNIDIGSASDRSSVSRFPLIAAAVPIGGRIVLGISASTLADRSFETSYEVTEILNGVEVTSTETLQALGALNDVRVAAAFRIVPSFRVGVGLHGITGENRVTVRRTNFEDEGSAGFGQVNRVSYGGVAGSVGAIWNPLAPLSIAASARFGGRMRAYENDTVSSEASVPDRFGAEIAYSGLRGVVLSARAEVVDWEEMEGLRDPESADREPGEGLPPLEAILTTDVAVGADFVGPRAFGRIIPLRLGVRRRELPFSLGRWDVPNDAAFYSTVEETAVSGGFGIPLARERALFDVAVQRAMRSAAEIEENAWTISVSLTIRP
jgi:hypothetical protein